MNRKMLGGLVLTLGVAMALAGCSSQEKNGKANQKVLRIGVSSYDQYDTFVSELISCFQNYAKEKEKEWGITISLDIRYAQRSQMVQNGQMDDFIDDQVDIACINLVDRTDASGIIEKARKSQTPVIFFNRELVEEDLDRWDEPKVPVHIVPDIRFWQYRYAEHLSGLQLPLRPDPHRVFSSLHKSS